ncbi:hypothetical protein [Pseudotamlana carrageenivorans]|uniref:Uncharacterized protein n=1 Tax=Pseudotamlana carrageenivorans TaxID=2069432 RepID=A0A2I7SKQ6_9FLAO|nr:hypothetical protein [Tamlana carrageenivorans]AUS06460.1 hypothetical protein C1A40_13845 [Tamlana carrageenivorans]
MLTSYTVKSKNSDNVWEFKYDLNGNLKAFKVLSGVLSNQQMIWFFRKGNFPVLESVIKTIWIPNLKQNFEITIGEPDLSFEAFWNSYGNKVGKRKETENKWTRLSKAEKLQVLSSIPKYNNYLKHYPKQQKQYPSTYLNQEAYKNDWKI